MIQTKKIFLIIIVILLFIFQPLSITTFQRVTHESPLQIENLCKGTPSYFYSYDAVLEEHIDQNQSVNSGASVTIDNASWYYAQRFQPTMNILTKFSIFLGKQGLFPQDSTCTIILRKHLHVDFSVYEINLSTINENGTWISCAFEGIPVDVNESYYITCHCANVSDSAYLEWYFGSDNPYLRGNPLLSKDGREWNEFLYYNNYDDIDFCFRTYGLQNHIPLPPQKPEGITEGQFEKPYSYKTKTTDLNDGDELYYQWSWGDGTYSEWLGPYQSDEICEAEHTWNIKGSYVVKVKAKDQWDFESDWSEPLIIRMTKKKGHIFSNFLDILHTIFTEMMGNFDLLP